MYRLTNITLPEEIVRLVDRMAPKRDRSRFIAEAITYYTSASRRADLKRRLREGAVRRADRDHALVGEWSERAFFLIDRDGVVRGRWIGEDLEVFSSEEILKVAREVAGKR
jgi:CopG family transcriptional regulator / antitoxin EndoAI